MAGEQFSANTNQEVLLYRIYQSLSGGISTTSTVNTSITQGRKVVAVAGTPEALVASTTACKSVTIQAEKDNTSDIIVGGSGVVGPLATREGVYLSPGDSIDIPIDDVNKIYIDALVSTEGVTFIYFN